MHSFALSRRLACSICIGLLAFLLSGCATTQPSQWVRPASITLEEASLVITSPFLASRITDLESRSPTFRVGMDSLRQSGMRLYVSTPEDLGRVLPNLEFSPVFGPGVALPYTSSLVPDSVLFVVILVESERMREIYTQHERPRAHYYLDLDLVLAHEIYTHAVPLARDGRITSMCEDPTPEQMLTGRVDEACSIQRENLIRRDLGLSLRTDYGPASLSFPAALGLLIEAQAAQSSASEPLNEPGQ